MENDGCQGAERVREEDGEHGTGSERGGRKEGSGERERRSGDILASLSDPIGLARSGTFRPSRSPSPFRYRPRSPRRSTSRSHGERRPSSSSSCLSSSSSSCSFSSLSGSDPGGGRGNRLRGDKPGGKRKYKSRHLDDPTWQPSLERGMYGEEKGSRGGERERRKDGGKREHREKKRKRRERRSPSIEIIYEGTFTSVTPHQPGRKRGTRKRNRKRPKDLASSPVIITIDSDSSHDDHASLDLGNDDLPIDFSVAHFAPLPLVDGTLDVGVDISDLPVDILDQSVVQSGERAGSQSKLIHPVDHNEEEEEEDEDVDYGEEDGSGDEAGARAAPAVAPDNGHAAPRPRALEVAPDYRPTGATEERPGSSHRKELQSGPALPETSSPLEGSPGAMTSDCSLLEAILHDLEGIADPRRHADPKVNSDLRPPPPPPAGQDSGPAGAGPVGAFPPKGELDQAGFGPVDQFSLKGELDQAGSGPVGAFPLKGELDQAGFGPVDQFPLTGKLEQAGSGPVGAFPLKGELDQAGFGPMMYYLCEGSSERYLSKEKLPGRPSVCVESDPDTDPPSPPHSDPPSPIPRWLNAPGGPPALLPSSPSRLPLQTKRHADRSLPRPPQGCTASESRSGRCRSTDSASRERPSAARHPALLSCQSKPALFSDEGDRDSVSPLGSDPIPLSVVSSHSNPTSMRNSHPIPLSVVSSHSNPLSMRNSHPIPLSVVSSHSNPTSMRNSHPNTLAMVNSHPNPMSMRNSHPNTLPTVNSHPIPSSMGNSHPNTLPMVNSHPNTLAIVNGHPIPSSMRSSHPNTLVMINSHSNTLSMVNSHPNTLSMVNSHPNILSRGNSHPNTLSMVNSHPIPLSMGNSHPNTLAMVNSHPVPLSTGNSHPNTLAMVNSHPVPLSMGNSHPNTLAMVNSHPNTLSMVNSHPMPLSMVNSHPIPLSMGNSQSSIETLLTPEDALPSHTHSTKSNPTDTHTLYDAH